MVNKDIWQETINQFSTLVKKHNPEVLAGIESRGFIFASTIAYKLNCEVVMIRKKANYQDKQYRIHINWNMGKIVWKFKKEKI